MGQLRAAANALGRTLAEPGAILEALDAFAADVPGAEYASCAVLMLDGTTRATIAFAGHPPLLHVRASGGWTTVDVGRGPLLGVPGARPTASFAYEIDDVLLMYTDGLTERRGTDPDAQLDAIGRFVADRLDAPCERIAAELIDAFGRAADDDVVVLALRPRNHRSPDYLLQPQLPPTIAFS
jgi:serine phosphatase RsbU (regulator of sigma subunit)